MKFLKKFKYTIKRKRERYFMKLWEKFQEILSKLDAVSR